MELQDTLEELDETLSAIHRVLTDEYAALCKLDGPSIDDAVARKVELNEKLRALIGQGVISKEQRESLTRVRAAAQKNQALLVHARACVRGALAAACGISDGAVYSQRSAASNSEAPLRLNMRG